MTLILIILIPVTLAYIDNNKNYVLDYVYKYAMQKKNVHFLFVSNDKGSLSSLKQTPNTLVLDVLSNQDEKDEIVKWIQEEFGNVSYQPDDKDIQKFADSLQYFPLALTSAVQEKITFVKDEKVFGSQNGIQDSLNKDEFILKHLKEAWNATIEKIKQKGYDGRNACLILDHISSKNSEEFEPKQLLTLFDDNRDFVKGAMNLLERYSIVSLVKNGVFKINATGQAIQALNAKLSAFLRNNN